LGTDGKGGKRMKKVQVGCAKGKRKKTNDWGGLVGKPACRETRNAASARPMTLPYVGDWAETGTRKGRNKNPDNNPKRETVTK